MPITVRRATRKDISTLGRLGALLVRTHHDFDPKRFLEASEVTEDGYGSYLVTQLDRTKVALLVAEDDGVVIGYAYAGVEGVDYMSLRGPAGIVYDVVVDPAHRRRGAGRALLRAVKEFFLTQGMQRAVLSTAVKNESAQQLFASEGFRPTMVEMTAELDD